MFKNGIVYNHAKMMEGPRTKLRDFNPKHFIVQVGWLGATGRFYPIYFLESRIRETEPGSYSPIYMEID